MRHALVLTFACLLAGCAASGPAVTAWESTGGPAAQNITTLLLDKHHRSTLFAGLASGELAVSTDDGATWTTRSVIAADAAVHRLVQDPEAPLRMLAATDAGLALSTDEGKNWKWLPIGSARAARPVHACAIDPWNTRVIFAGVQGEGIFRSTDGGGTWHSANGQDTALASGDPRDIIIEVSRPDLVSAAVGGVGVVRSTDAGATWSRLSELPGPAASVPVVMAATPSALIFGTSAGALCTSHDGGRTWSITRPSPEGGSVSSLVRPPGQPRTVLAGTESGVLRSTDDGATWAPFSSSLPRLWMSITASGTDTARPLFVFAPGFGLQRSSDHGASWTSADAGLGGASVQVLRCDEGTDTLFAAAGPAMLAYSARSNTWTPVSKGLTGGTITAIALDPGDRSRLFVASTSGVFRSTDGGGMWEPAMRGFPMVPMLIETHPWIRNRAFCSGQAGLFVSTDHGGTWSKTRPYAIRHDVLALSFDPSNAARILGVTRDGGTLVTADGGISWQASRHGIAEAQLRTVSLDENDPSVCYLWSADGQGFRSLDGGVEWNRYSPPWKAGDTVQIGIDRVHPSSVVALVNDSKLYYSASGGGAWFPIPITRLPGRALSLSWRAGTSVLYAGTHNKGVYRLPLTEALRPHAAP